MDDHYDYNRDRLVNATDQILARNNRTSPFTALKLITPPLESGGDEGEGEGEGEAGGGRPEAGGDRWVPRDDADFAYGDPVDNLPGLPSAAISPLSGALPDAPPHGLPWRPDLVDSAHRVRRTFTQRVCDSVRPLPPPSPLQLAAVPMWFTRAERQPLGRLDEVGQRDNLARRIHWMSEQEADDELDTHDLALAKLLAEWEPF